MEEKFIITLPVLRQVVQLIMESKNDLPVKVTIETLNKLQILQSLDSYLTEQAKTTSNKEE